MPGIFCLGNPEKNQGGNEYNALRSASKGEEHIGIQLDPSLWRVPPSLLRLVGPDQRDHPPDTDPAQVRTRPLKGSYGVPARGTKGSLEALGKGTQKPITPRPETHLAS